MEFIICSEKEPYHYDKIENPAINISSVVGVRKSTYGNTADVPEGAPCIVFTFAGNTQLMWKYSRYNTELRDSDYSKILSLE